MVMMTKMIMMVMVMMIMMIMMMITLIRGEKRLEVENEIRKQVDNIMREELDLLKMVRNIVYFHYIALYCFNSFGSKRLLFLYK